MKDPSLIQSPATASCVHLAVLLCHADVPMAMGSLPTLQKFSHEPIRWTIISDGTVLRDDVSILEKKLGPLRFVDVAERHDLVAPLLKTRPALARYRSEHHFGVKLVDVPVAMGLADFVYCDTDIVAFAPFAGLQPVTQTYRCAFMRDPMSTYCLGTRLRNLPWTPKHFKVVPFINAGLYWLGQQVYDPDFLQALVARGYARGYDIPLLEQTAWASLAARNPSAYYDPQLVGFPPPRERVNKPALVHFAGPWRKFMHDPEYLEHMQPGVAASGKRALVGESVDRAIEPLSLVPTRRENWLSANLDAMRTRQYYRQKHFPGYEPIP